MSDPNQDIIRISKEEVMSERVDDLLKRQMSLRGEGGVTRDRKRKWYYQNWLVLMLAGILGAIVAWGIYESLYKDFIYSEGIIGQIDFSDEIPFEKLGNSIPQELYFPMQGSFQLGDTKMYLMVGAREVAPDGTTKYVSLESLSSGNLGAAYYDYYDTPEVSFGVCAYLKRKVEATNPPSLQSQYRQNQVMSMLIFGVVGATVGLFIGAMDGIVCRLPRRALIGGVVGMVVGLAGGLVSAVLASIVYAPISQAALKLLQSDNLVPLGYLLQMIGRSVSWGLAGMAMGLGQGVALRSKRLLIFGFMGGVIGGLLGGLFFDPINSFVVSPDTIGAHWSRLIAFCIVGASVGSMIGVVELLARDAWLRMTQGPLSGKEFLLYNDVMNVGASSKSDLYLFNDPKVADNHAVIRSTGDQCEIETRSSSHPVFVNGRSVTRARLRHGDTVTIGQTIFVFQQRKTS